MIPDGLECHLCSRAITSGYELLGGTICNPCYSRIRRSATACPRCQEIKVLAFCDEVGAAVCAGCAGEPARFACKDCGSEVQLTGSQCGRCRMKDRATALLSQDNGTVHPGFKGLYQHFLATPDPRTVTRWISHSPIKETLRSMAQGQLPISHMSLDQLTQTHRVRYLREVLVSAGTLPAQDMQLHAYEVYSSKFISAIPPNQASIISRYQRWYVLRIMRRSSAQTPTSVHALNRRRAELRAIAAFLTWLDNQGHCLETATQAHLDHYFATTTDTATVLSTFIRWAHEQHLASEIDPPRKPSRPGTAASHEELWDKVEFLLHDDSTERDVRIIGLFLLLFGQRVTNTVRLKHSDVEVSGPKVSVRFGTDAIELPPALATLVLAQLQMPTSRYIYHRPEISWLFNGLIPGQHITPNHITMRLSEAGIKARPFRQAAMLQLAAAIPVSVLADTLGMSVYTAAQWAQRSGHTWNDYPAIR